jgi:hypothetical protein
MRHDADVILRKTGVLQRDDGPFGLGIGVNKDG